MPTRFRAQVSLERDGGLPKDACVNVWHFEGDANGVGGVDRASWDTQAPGLMNRLQTFYAAIAGSLSAVLSGNVTVKLYDMQDPSTPGSPRIPRVTNTFAIPVGTTTLPAECAVVLTMEGAKTPGTNPRRRRGRVFIGPLTSTWMAASLSGPDTRPDVNRRQSLLDAAEVMALGSDGAARLAVYSPTSSKSVPGDQSLAWTDVETLSVDDAFDTQRRRGAAPSSRLTKTVQG